MKRITLASAVVLSTLTVISACPLVSALQAKTNTQTSVQTQYVDVGGYKLTLQVAGAGTPTVVLDYGLGGSGSIALVARGFHW